MVPSKPSAQISKRPKQKKRSKASSSAVAELKPTAPKERIPTSDLKWRTVKNTASFAGIDEGGGMMMLEELDDVGIEWQEQSGAKIAKFVASASSCLTEGRLTFRLVCLGRIRAKLRR